MYTLHGRLVLAATDLNEFVACRHLTALNLAAAQGTVERPGGRDEHAALVARKGDEHERAHLASLKAQGLRVIEIAGGVRDVAAAAEATLAAMRTGADVIYQGVFTDGQWVGHADFLLRVEHPSPVLGAWSYEVADAKLARRAKPYFLLQLCLYTELLARVQESAPDLMHVVLGTKERHSFRHRDFDAYFRRLKGRFAGYVGDAAAESYPHPVEHCAVCAWAPRCDTRRAADDHPSLVAHIRRDQIVKLAAAGITTLAALGRSAPTTRVSRLAPATFAALHQQARLQLRGRETGEHHYELLEPQPGRGFALLPPPSSGDIFLDMEGDPYVEAGLEYLFGLGWVEDGAWRFQAVWAHSREEEKAAFEQVIDLITERRRADPGLHVYHYAHYEPTALKRLAGAHGTREEELDDLLRHGVLVDLYRVVRQAMRVSQPSYSIKKLECFHAETPRTSGITDGEASTVAYERWLELRDGALLAEIERYNAEDVGSTRSLRDWLLARRAEAEARLGPNPWTPPEPRERGVTAQAHADESAGLAERLRAGPQDDGCALMAHLLEYHRREERPAWWAFFARCQAEPEELLEDPEAIAGLELEREERAGRSTVLTFSFPPQECKLRESEVCDPATGKGTGTLVEVAAEEGRLKLHRRPGLAHAPVPRAVMAGRPYDTGEQRAALRRLGDAIADRGGRGPGPYRGLRDTLLREPPRVRGVEHGAALCSGSVSLEDAARIVERLDHSYLFIQGPPGSGKTWTGGQLIVRLLTRGKRVGVAANSHKAIHNLLHEVEAAAKGARVRFRGLKKATADNAESIFESKLPRAFIVNSTEPGDFPPRDAQLAAGTAWLFARRQMDGALDYLFIDEAGQVSLADALAMGTAARNLVLLGDPQQLAQVSQGAHPEGAGVSVLEHLLGDHETIPAERGLFLDRTRRMHPDVCRFISGLCYESRLGWIPECERQRIEARGPLTGTGVRYLPVEHEGNSQSSVEEADVIAKAVDRLAGARLIDQAGGERALGHGDILVVAPYNAQVHCLRRRLPAEVHVGTVDKFQGREAPVVFFSMATSSGAELPRRLEFLFSRNRLNVAISRAQCLAVLVASPRLLDVECRTVEQMRMVNGLCRLVEVAEGG